MDKLFCLFTLKVATDKKPNIVYVVPAIAREGISKQVLLQIDALIKREYNVKIIVLTAVDTRVLAEFAPSLTRERIIELKQPDSYLSVKALKSSVFVALQLRNYCRVECPDIVFAHAPYAHFIMRLVMLFSFQRRANIKLWQYFHVTQYLEFPINSWKRKLKNMLQKLLTNNFDYGHIFVSEAVKRDINANLLCISNSIVIYNSLPQFNNEVATAELNIKSYPYKADVFTLLIPGRIEASKGQLWFLEPLQLFLQLEQLIPSKIQIIIVGEGEQLVEMKQKILEKELQLYVNVVGNLSNTHLLGYMKQSSVVVVPSFIEGLPLVILEALQQKATVLASDIQPNKEIISSREVGILFESGNIEDCVAKLQFIYKYRNGVLVNTNAIESILQTKFSFVKHMRDLVSVIEKA